MAGLVVDLSRDKHLGDKVVVRATERLSGKLLSDSQGFEIDEVSAPGVLLDLMQLTFGSLTLLSKGETKFEGLTAALGTRTGELTGRIVSWRTHAAELSVHIGALTISAQLEADELALDLRGSAGTVQAARATFRNLVVESAGAVRIMVPELHSEALKIGWGDPSFKLSFRHAQASELELTRASMQLRGTGVALSDVEYHAGALQAGSGELARVEGNLTLAKDEPAKGAPAPAPRPSDSASAQPLWDRALLDHLSGNLNVDVELDLAVPIIGRRRATHELRVPIEDGSVDYRVLESGLSRLEDSLLDFAVRDGALVLEVGIPLVGVRGRGKPLVFWDLSPEDYLLAERNRVRLAVLPTVRGTSARQSEPPPDPSSNGGSRFALRHMTLANIDTNLSLRPQAEPMDAALRELVVGALHMQGTIHHDPESPPREGVLRIDADKVTATLHALPVGRDALSGSTQLARIEDATLRFEGTRLVQVTLALTEVAIETLALAPTPPP